MNDTIGPHIVIDMGQTFIITADGRAWFEHEPHIWFVRSEHDGKPVWQRNDKGTPVSFSLNLDLEHWYKQAGEAQS